MKTFYGIAYTFLALILCQHASAKCGKSSAFRYEFENWLQRYILDVIGSISGSVEHIYNITLTELELEKAQEIDFQAKLSQWHTFTVRIESANVELDEAVKDFRLKCQEFELEKSLLGLIATKNIMKALDDLENTTEAVSKKYAEDIFKDWKEFFTDQDFETLAQQKDCNKINELMEDMQALKQKTEALNEMANKLLNNYEMSELKILLPKPNEFGMY